MTEQYQSRNINNPDGSFTITNSAGTPNYALTPSFVGQTVIFDTTAAVGTITLPRAAESGGSAEITIIFPGAAVNAATLAIITTGTTDVLVRPAGAPVNPAITANASVTVRSDGASTWYIVSGLA